MYTYVCTHMYMNMKKCYKVVKLIFLCTECDYIRNRQEIISFKKIKI